VTGMVNPLAALPDQVVLVVDDYHLRRSWGWSRRRPAWYPGPGVVAPITAPSLSEEPLEHGGDHLGVGHV
jgi:hypothetical protein